MRYVTWFVQRGLLALATVAVMGVWTPASAQDSAIDKVSFGYKFYRVSVSEADAVNYPIGFYVDADGHLRFNPNLKWIAELSLAHRSESDDFGFDLSENILFAGGGIKREFTGNPDITPHVQALVGFVRSSISESFDGEDVFDDSDTAFAFKISGAIDKVLNDRWDVRVGAGYIHAFSDPGSNIIRFFVGVVRKMN